MDSDVLVETVMIKTRVLVVEAETNISAELDGRLRRLGYELTGRADTGEAAIRAAKDSRPDVVLMDKSVCRVCQALSAHAVSRI